MRSTRVAAAAIAIGALEAQAFAWDADPRPHPRAARELAAAGCDMWSWQDAEIEPEAQVSKLLACMTLEEKVGQMMLTSSRQIDDGQIEDVMLGGYFYGGTTGFEYDGGNGPSDWLEKSAAKQKEAVCSTRLQIPLLIAVDRTSLIQGAVTFPHHIGLGAMCAGLTGAELSVCASVMHNMGQALAKEAKSVGAHQIYEPNLCIAHDVRWGRTYECFGEDAELVQAMSVVVDGIQSQGLLATAKHFLSDGATTFGTGKDGLLDRGDAPLSSLEDSLLPFATAVNKHGVGTVMTSYSSLGGVRMHENGYLLTDVLREECAAAPVLGDWFAADRVTCYDEENESEAVTGVPPIGFCGLIMTDFDALHFNQGTDEQQVRNGIVAGNDMLMFPLEGQAAEMLDLIVSRVCGDVSDGCGTTGYGGSTCIPTERIDEAASHVLLSKAQVGLLSGPWPLAEDACGAAKNLPEVSVIADEAGLEKKAARRLALKTAEKGQVLLKNVGGVLPLDQGKVNTVLLAGTGADSVGRMCGGWTINWQGSESYRQDGTSVQEALEAAGFNVVTDSDAAKEAADADGEDSVVALVVASEEQYAEYEGDRDDGIPLPMSDMDDIESVCGGDGWPCVVVLAAGRPVDMGDVFANDNVHAVVHAWLPGSEGGQAVVNKLFALGLSRSRTFDYDGKLPVSWPKDISEGPASDKLFPYAYGCSTLESSSHDGIACDASAYAQEQRRRHARQ